MTENLFRELPKTAGYLAKLSKPKSDQLHRIIVRYYQAHRRQDLLDWHSQTGMLLIVAGNAMRIARSAEDREFAADLFLLADLSYSRSLEFAPPDLSHLPHLMSAAA